MAEERGLPPAGVPRAEDVAPKNWRSATPTATAAQSTSPPITIARSLARRTRSGTATARSPYSTSLRKLTRWSAKSASSSETGRNVWNASHTSSSAPEIHNVRPGAQPPEPGSRRHGHGGRAGRRRRPDRTAGCRLSSSRDRRRARADSARGRRGTAARARAPVLRVRRDRRGCGGWTTSACCRTPWSSPRHYRAPPDRIRPRSRRRHCPT